MNEPNQPERKFNEPQEVTGPELPAVMKQAGESGFFAQRMEVLKGASYRVHFGRLPTVPVPPRPDEQ